MNVICRKSNLSRLIKKLNKFFPDEYNFYPKSWVTPVDMHDLREFVASKKHAPLLICKPEASCQGRGIFLTKKLDDVPKEKIFVVQEYLKNPCLINQFKFDLRIYVLVTCCDPLRIYLYKDGLARFATEKYKPIINTNSKKKNRFMHLTNYAVNKRNKNYCQGDEEDDEDSHKRSVLSILESLKEDEGADIDKIWQGIREITVKTILGVQPELSHIYKACHPSDKIGGMCFEVLGFDIILDKNYRPWLLEVNNSPSYNTDSPLDRKIKSELFHTTFKMLGISQNDKKIVKTMEKLEYEKRGHRPEIEQQQKDLERSMFYQKVLEDKIKTETNNIGLYEKVFPCEDESRMKSYNAILAKAKIMWIESTSGPSNKRPAKSKSTAKSPTKSEAASKKAVVSPFKKIYCINDSAKQKAKKGDQISIKSSEIKIKDNGNTQVNTSSQFTSGNGVNIRQELNFIEMKNSDNKLLHSKQDIINDKLATESIITQEKNVFKIRETPKVKYFDIKNGSNCFSDDKAKSTFSKSVNRGKRNCDKNLFCESNSFCDGTQNKYFDKNNEVGSKCNTIDETSANAEKRISSAIKLSECDWSSPVKETLVEVQITQNKIPHSKEEINSAVNSHKIVKQSTERTSNKSKYIDSK